MRYLFALLLLFSFINAAQTKQKVTLGAGPYIQTQPYKDVDAILLPSPVIFFDNSLFYVRWSRWGVYFLGEKKEDYAWGLSLTMMPRPYGYKAGDSKYLEGMQERKNTLEAGLALSASYEHYYLESMLLTDMFHRHEAWILRNEIGAEYAFGDFTLYPSLLLIYQSQKFNDYYYGVQRSEVDAALQRDFFSPNAGLQLGVQTFLNYKIDKNYSILTNIRVDALPQEVSDFPLLEEEYIYSGLLSLMYSFDY